VWNFPSGDWVGFRLVSGMRKARLGGCWRGLSTLSSSEPSNMVFMVGMMVSWVGKELKVVWCELQLKNDGRNNYFVARE